MKKNRNSFFSQYGTVSMNSQPYLPNMNMPNFDNKLYTLEQKVQELEQRIYNLENTKLNNNNSMYMI